MWSTLASVLQNTYVIAVKTKPVSMKMFDWWLLKQDIAIACIITKSYCMP